MLRMLALLLTAIAALADVSAMDLAALDQVIEKCERDKALPVFLAEPKRRSDFLTFVYSEQLAISSERSLLAQARRTPRATPPPQTKEALPAPAQADQDLVSKQILLDDRQRALDEVRRVESIRREAVDEKRQYFLSRCPSTRK